MTMTQRQKYRRKPGTPVTAVRLDLDTDGLSYRKWGDEQRAKPGDWLVDNGGDIYTVDGETFRKTYRETSPGRYEKQGVVWAEKASSKGRIETQEGTTGYEAGDYLVFNDAHGEDGYAVSADKFAELYEPE